MNECSHFSSESPHLHAPPHVFPFPVFWPPRLRFHQFCCQNILSKRNALKLFLSIKWLLVAYRVKKKKSLTSQYVAKGIHVMNSLVIPIISNFRQTPTNQLPVVFSSCQVHSHLHPLHMSPCQVLTNIQQIKSVSFIEVFRISAHTQILPCSTNFRHCIYSHSKTVLTHIVELITFYCLASLPSIGKKSDVYSYYQEHLCLVYDLQSSHNIYMLKLSFWLIAFRLECDKNPFAFTSRICKTLSPCILSTL